MNNLRKENSMERAMEEKAEDRLVRLIRHLGEYYSEFGEVTVDLVYQDALIKYIFPEYNIRYWNEPETNDEYEVAVLEAIEVLKGEIKESSPLIEEKLKEGISF